MALANLVALLGGLSGLSQKIEYTMLSVDQLSVLRAQLQHKSQLSPDEVFNDDSDIVGRLFQLKLDIENARHSDLLDKIGLEAANFLDSFEEQIKANTNFASSIQLQQSLEQLSQKIGSIKASKTKKSITLKRVIFAMTAVPLLGFALHYFSGEYYQAAFIDEADVLFPRGVHQIAKASQEIQLNHSDGTFAAFGRYYFQDFIANGNSSANSHFPGIIDVLQIDEYVDDSRDMEAEITVPYGANLPFIKNIISTRPELMGSSEMLHANHLRFYIKNIRANHLISTLTLNLSKKEELLFPWDKLPTKSKVEMGFSSYYDGSMQVNSDIQFNVLNAPAKDLSYRVSFLDSSDAVIATSKGSVDGYLFAGQSNKVVTDLPEHTVMFDNVISAVYIDESQKEQTEWINSNWQVIDLSLPDAQTQLNGVPIYSSWYDPVVLSCGNGAKVFLGYFRLLARARALTSIDNATVEYEYQSVINEKFSDKHQLEMPNGAWLLDEALSLEHNKVQECLAGFEAFDFFGILLGNMDTAAGYPSLPSLINGLTMATMSADKIAKSQITAEYQTAFVGVEQDAAQHIDTSIILQDGHYLKLDVITVNLKSGKYQLKVFADDEFAGEYQFEVLLPDHFLFEPSEASVNSTPFAPEN